LRIKLSKYIVADPEVCHGKPVFENTRVLVSDVLELMAAGLSVEEVLEEYPSLTRDMVLDALSYAAKVFKGEAYARFVEVPTG